MAPEYGFLQTGWINQCLIKAYTGITKGFQETMTAESPGPQQNPRLCISNKLMLLVVHCTLIAKDMKLTDILTDVHIREKSQESSYNVLPT